MLVDYHIHGLAHGEYRHVMEDIEPFVANGVKQGLGEMGFTEHDRFIDQIDFSLYSKLQEAYPQIKIRIGLEVEYRANREAEFKKYISAYPFDYVIGSVHEVEDWPFDNDAYITEYQNWDVDQLYQRYFSLLADMAQTRLCQVVGHLDLIKVFGYRPNKSIQHFLPAVLKAIKDAKMAVEINTNGWHKPIQEVYPATEVLETCFAYDLPITLSSDAHRPEQVGRDIPKAVELAKKIGYRKIATFHQKKMIIQPLG